MRRLRGWLKGLFLISTAMILLAGVFASLPSLILFFDKHSEFTTWVNNTLVLFIFFVGIIWSIWFMHKGLEVLKTETN